MPLSEGQTCKTNGEAKSVAVYSPVIATVMPAYTMVGSIPKSGTLGSIGCDMRYPVVTPKVVSALGTSAA